MVNKEVWISALIVVVILSLGVFLTQKTNWFESSYNYSDYENLGDFNDLGDGVVMDFPSTVPSANECQTDSDCVASSCCHSTSCLAKENAPDCKGMICTLDCRPGTLDCGQGSCLCNNGKCAAKIIA